MEKAIDIEEQIIELTNFYRRLKYRKIQRGIYIIYGELEFKTVSPEVIRGKYNVEIQVTKRFPVEVPIVKEVGGIIPDDFHKNDSKTLCLGVETEIKLFLKNMPNLLKFVNSFVIPYFYSFKIWQKTGKFPFGERPHFVKGIIEFYKEYLLLNDLSKIINVLKYIYNKGDLNGYCRCPCGSGRSINECFHQEKLKELSKINIKDDLYYIYWYFNKINGKRKKSIIYPLTLENFNKLYGIKNK